MNHFLTSNKDEYDNYLELDINIDENIKNNDNIINNNSLGDKQSQNKTKSNLDNNKYNMIEKNNKIIKNNNKEEMIYESYDNDFTIIDNKPLNNCINNNKDINSLKNKKENKISINSNNNDNYINFNNYDFESIKNKNNLNYSSNTTKKENNTNNINDINYKSKRSDSNIDKNNINDNDNNVIEDIHLSKQFKKKISKKENDILDFENIELPEESQYGEFTEIKGPYILNNKKEEEDNKKNQNNILLDFFNNQAANLKKSINNSYFNLFNKNNNSNDSNTDPNQLFKSCINLRSRKNDINIIKIMAVLKSSNNQSWKDNLKSLVSSIYYNDYGLSKKFDKYNPVLPLYIFDTEIDSIVETERLLKSYLYMSYRSGFINLNSIGCEDYSSDCGWGCMLRCCQMILSRGLIQKKFSDFFNKKYSILDNDCIDNIRKETLSLFNDNYLPVEEIKNHPDYQYFWKNYKDLTKTNTEYNSISEIIPPYSIHILCKLGKCAGQYTSDIKIIKLISNINSQIFNDINIIFFECGYISRRKLIMSFCEEYTNFNSNYLDTITYNGVDYIFKKGGIIFISFRLGLSELDPSYYDKIPLLFKKFHNNLGFVSGKRNRAYYFIGVQGDNKLIFADPHYNQYVTNNADRDYESYYTDNLYLLDIKDLSSELTLGIGIFNSRQFTQFFDDLKWFNEHMSDLNFITIGKD